MIAISDSWTRRGLNLVSRSIEMDETVLRLSPTRHHRTEKITMIRCSVTWTTSRRRKERQKSEKGGKRNSNSNTLLQAFLSQILTSQTSKTPGIWSQPSIWPKKHTKKKLIRLKWKPAARKCQTIWSQRQLEILYSNRLINDNLLLLVKDQILPNLWHKNSSRLQLIQMSTKRTWLTLCRLRISWEAVSTKHLHRNYTPWTGKILYWLSYSASLSLAMAR